VIVSPSDTPTTLPLRLVSAALYVARRVSRRRIGMGLGMIIVSKARFGFVRLALSST
jgi:hypothetical protein